MSMQLDSLPDVAVAQDSVDQVTVARIPLPESPALVCSGDVVVQANQAAVTLAGRWLPDSLTGLSLRNLLMGPNTDAETDAELIRPDGRTVPVRVTRWAVPATDLLVVFLVDISDLCSAGRSLSTGEFVEERGRLLQAQRIAQIGSFTWEWPTNKINCSSPLRELFAGRCVDAADPFRYIHPEDLPDLFRR
ncbi:MAG: PAS domain-containing protein, partial [Pseudonocardiaceae bacterium]